MIQTGIESRIKIQDIISNQLPEYLQDESQKAVDFLKQYYISQEYQGGPVDIAENLDQYLKLDNLTSEVVVGFTTLTFDISADSTIITVPNTKGFPNEYGLLKIDDEIITYTGLTTNTFTGCVRGFSGITSYHQDLNQEELIFSDTTTDSHNSNSRVHNLSSLFLKEFYKKLKSTYTPGFEDRTFNSQINAGNFIKESKSFYQSKGTRDSFRILFNVLYGEIPQVINLEEYLIKPSDANFIRREVCIAEAISGDITKAVGQTLTKTTDSSTNASISSAEIFTRGQKQYFKIGLFVGYDDNSNVQGNFIITPNSKILENVSIGSSVISVDSTIGFGQTGTIYSGNNIITYSDKSINQFLGCSGIIDNITATEDIFSDDTYFSYENGDTSKKVVITLRGVLSDFIQKSESIFVDQGQILPIKSIGTLIENPEQNKTYREIFANSWIYNTSSSIKIDSFVGGSNPTGAILQSSVDRSQLKKGDCIELIDEETNNIIYPTDTTDIPYINADIISNSISIGNLNAFSPNEGQSIKLRRKINKANSTNVNFKYQNNSIISDIQNMYVDDDNFAYIASNSLPSWGKGFENSYTYQITKTTNSASISSSSGDLIDKDDVTQLYTTILFDTPVPFISGEKVQYIPDGEPLIGLEEGPYYVKVLSNNKQIKLYTSSSSFLYSDANAIQFKSPTLTLGSHRFILYSQKSNVINPQKILKKFSLNSNIEDGIDEKTLPGSIGMLINGVEISNYKTSDKVYYGPIEDVKVLNGGSNFDVINAPEITISNGVGTTSLVLPVISGTITDIIADKQEFDIEEVLSINITGGNVFGGFFEPVVTKRRREVLFDGRETTQGGGISTTTNQLTFSSNHNFLNGQKITYRNNGYDSISIGIGVSTLSNNASYFAKIDNNTTIRLFNTYDDYVIESNQISFASTSISGSGIHKFLTEDLNNTISEIKVIEGGSFTNRKLLVKPTGISTAQNSIYFKNHGFNSGEIVEYSYETSAISGITTSNQYYILKLDENSFRLCDAGIGGTNTTNYERENYEKLNTTGNGFQKFKYPDIKVNINFTTVGIGTSTQIQSIEATPIIKGSIEQVYVYEPGTGYGSNILNFEKKPSLTVKTGRDARITPIIFNGSIIETNIEFGGIDYFSTPDLVVLDPTNAGSGAKLRAVVIDNKITSVSIINGGIGYATSTTVDVVSSGSGEILEASIRGLAINQVEKFPVKQTEILKDVNNELSYSVTGYFQNLKSSFNDTNTTLSNIIGWAYDGNPIYGPYSIVDPGNINSGIKTMTSSYTKSITNVYDRPSESDFPLGFFIEDYGYNPQYGDLDKNNGRFSKTKDFPNGIYAYYACIDEITGDPLFPYFIGDSFRSNTIDENESLDQQFNFNNSSLSRNTLGYKILESGATNDFIIENEDIKSQKILVESVSKGSVSDISILNSGDNYKVEDLLNFNNNNTNGGGIYSKVSSLKGRNINAIETLYEVYDDALFTWRADGKVTVTISPFHTLSNNDNVVISGFDTSHLSTLNNSFKISVPFIPNVGLTTEIVSSGADTTEIYVTQIPAGVSVGSIVGIGTETLEILNVYPDKNIFRVSRGLPGTAHTIGVAVSFKPKTLTIDKNVDYFESNDNNRIYFNPQESVGFGTTAGFGYEVSYPLGQEVITKSILTQSISIENHSLQTNQRLTFGQNGNGTISISTSPTGISFTLPTTEPVYAVNKSANTIGIKTSLTSDEVFFISGGDNADNYYFDANNIQKLGKIQKIVSTVSISTSHSHGLVEGDSITMNVRPNLSVGVGTSTSVRVLYNSEIDNIIVNPIGFNSTGINTVTNEITILDHGLLTGNKVFYKDDEEILTKSEYYIYKTDEDTIKFCKTYIDSQKNPPTVVSFGSSGGSSQSISLINPQIQTIKNNNLVFDLTDSSLSGYQFRLYYDQDFKNEFVSTGSTETFSTIGAGTIGISTNASFTIKYGSELPERLYYSLEKSGYISSSDKDVNNFSEILFVDSVYNQTYNISGVGTTTFQISLHQFPEKMGYVSTECDNLEYTTTSTSASGPVNTIEIISSGSEYKKFPILSSVSTINGENLSVSLDSNTIGKIEKLEIINKNFEYSSDITLRPRPFISPKIKLKDSNTVGIVTIISGGSGYTSPPKIIAVNNNTKTILNSGLIIPEITGNSITNVIIDIPPKGISDQSAEFFAINNTNGVSIKKVESSNSGIFTCSITTPLLGFSENVFSVGEEVFIEGIQKFSVDGDGFNSSDYEYKFFEVIQYDNARITPGIIDDEVTVSIGGLGTNTGIAKIIQDSSGSIISKKNYPSFSISITPSEFEVGEKLLSNGIERDLEVIGYDNSGILKVIGTYNLSANEIITGKSTGNIATIESLTYYSGIFDIKFSNSVSEGWENATGKLSEDFQVLQDNDYYQNLSYSIKSRQKWNDIKTPVNSLVHSIGTKNFSDTEIISDSDERVGITSISDSTTIVKDYISEKRVDTINIFDFVKDIDLVQDRSKFLKLKNKKLVNYQESISNIVLRIDDISNKFSNSEDEPFQYQNILKIDDENSYSNYLLKVADVSGKSEVQLTNLLFLNDNKNIIMLQKQSLANVGTGFTTLNNEQYGDFSIEIDESDNKYLRFTPKDPFDTEYDIKYIEKKFDNQIIGVGTTSIGFIDVTSRSLINFPGITTNIIGVSSDNFTSFHVNAQIYKEVTNEMNFVELYVTHDGTNTNISEFYFDTKDIPYSDNLLGLFEADIDSGSFNLNYTNNSDEDVIIKTRIVGFGTTSVGVGTFRYSLPGQSEGNERSAIYESGFSTTTSGVSTSFLSLNKNAFDSARSLVEVSIGSTIKSIHQIMMISDKTDVYIQQSLSLSASNFADDNSFDDASGIGTFGGEISGDNVLVKFYPDSNFDGDIKINSFSECLYTQVDPINKAPDLLYGNSIETVGTSLYLAINGERINKDNFILRSNNIPIFAKSFDPSNSNITNLSTGNFTINNHFFSNNEELIYTPKSTFVGIGSIAMMYKNGSINEELPSQVFAIVHDNNNFSISTTKAGSAVTFTSVGEGNAHIFSMAKKNEKTIITIDNIAQYPLTFTKISQSLLGNGGGISTETNTFTLSGITSISPLDILRIDDEYMNIINVGLGTTNVGPITNAGTEFLVTVNRGFVGSSATSHTDGTQSRIYKGSYTIVDDTIFFTKAPRGNFNIIRTDNNLVFETSKFSGRVFLRQDYTTNEIYDNFSDEFNGIGRTFTLTINGENSVGAGTSGGNGLVFINGIFQTPTTLNNPNNNFSIIEQETPIGISSIEFSGIREDPANPNSILVSESDVNQNQIPRGGLVVSLGTTGGLGYAPLVGASVTAVVDATDGSIVSVGLGSTDINGSGYNGIVSIGISVYEDNHIGDVADIIVSNIGAGGTLSFAVGSGGTGYNNPKIFVSEPTYENLEVVGVSRVGVGATTDTGTGLLVSVDVGASSVAGIGSTYFTVNSFSISRSGYSFRPGDVFKPVGLVTDKNLSSPISEYEFTVLDVFNDNFGAWQFGELDYIDSVKNYQDGTRIRFPLEYNGSTLSFEKNENSTLDIQNVLIIICNGIIQDPGVSYLFDGGTAFSFIVPPKPEDNIDIFFYRGTRGLDDLQVNNVIPTLERGDDVTVLKNDTISGTITQDQRVVFDIPTSDKFETNLYKDEGIDENNYKPMSWTKQKTDRVINGEFIYKTRESTISQIYPTAKIIKDITASDSSIFVDSVSNFTYDLTIPGPFIRMAGLIVDGKEDPSPANITATIGAGGTVSSLTIDPENFGSGYVGSTVNIKFQNPLQIDDPQNVGVGTTATATATVGSGGTLTGTTITNPGFGYTVAPKTIIPFSDKNVENLQKIEFIKGFSGIITGIGTTSGSGGHPLALKFFLDRGATLFGDDLEVGYPIFIKDTIVGSGVTSVDSSDASVVGIGTTFLDNIYYVGEISVEGFVGIVTCNIDSGTDIIGLSTSGDYVGEFSWGLFTTITRSSAPISIEVSGKTVDVGLSTFPTIQRRGNGIRLTGALPEETS